MKVTLWIAALLCLVGAGLLLLDIGSPGLWIAVIAVGIALVAVSLLRRGSSAHG